MGGGARVPRGKVMGSDCVVSLWGETKPTIGGMKYYGRTNGTLKRPLALKLVFKRKFFVL